MTDDNKPQDIFKTITYALVNLTGLSLRQCRRIALNILERDRHETDLIIKSISVEVSNFVRCDRCNGFIFQNQECLFCSPKYRDQTKLMFVENSMNLDIMSRVSEYKGIIYNLCGNLMSPMNGVFSEDLPIESIGQLVTSLDNLHEVIFAFNLNFEVESTIFFLKNIIEKLNTHCVFYKLAQGIPVGSEIENVGLQAVKDAIKFKQKI